MMNDVQKKSVFEDWQAVVNAPRSVFFSGHTSDTVFDRARKGPVLLPSDEALFTQSNARVLLGHAAAFTSMEPNRGRRSPSTRKLECEQRSSDETATPSFD